MNKFENLHILAVTAKLDFTAVPLLEAELSKLLATGHTRIICDFSATEYISSAGLRVLLSALKRISKLGGRLLFCNLKPGVLEILNMVGFTSLFEIYESKEAALEQLQPNQKLKDTLLTTQKEEASTTYTANSQVIRHLDEKV